MSEFAVIEIPLTRGQVALIDARDSELVSAHRWTANPTPFGAFYATTSIKGKTVYMHRLIVNPPKGKEVDHINRNSLDNRRENLRAVTHLVENMRNGKFALATHCPRGHPYDEKNTIRMKRKNGRQCRECAKLRMRVVLATQTPEQRERRLARHRAYYREHRERMLGQSKANKARRRAAA